MFNRAFGLFAERYRMSASRRVRWRLAVVGLGVLVAGLAPGTSGPTLPNWFDPARAQSAVADSCTHNPKPVVSGQHTIWNFNGASPAGYPLQVTLTASGGGGPPYS